MFFKPAAAASRRQLLAVCISAAIKPPTLTKPAIHIALSQVGEFDNRRSQRPN
jgi:hypothetical protein